RGAVTRVCQVPGRRPGPRERTHRNRAAAGPMTATWPRRTSRVYPTPSGSRPRFAASGCMRVGEVRMSSSALTWGFDWWQVLGSNQRRLSRRFYSHLQYALLSAVLFQLRLLLRLFSATSGLTLTCARWEPG